MCVYVHSMCIYGKCVFMYMCLRESGMCVNTVCVCCVYLRLYVCSVYVIVSVH